MKLVGLPHTSGKEVEAKSFNSVAQGMRYLTKKSPISTAKDNGAVTVWYGDDGQWHAEQHRYCTTVGQWTGKVKRDIYHWLHAALVSIG